MTRKSKIRSISKAASLAVVAVLTCASPKLALGPQQEQAPSANSAPSVSRPASPNYKLGPDDVVTVYAAYAEYINGRQYRISKSGDVSFPDPVGVIHAQGMTAENLAAEIEKRQAETIRRPDVQVKVETQASQPITVTGAVNTPTDVQLEGGKSLLEVLTKVGWFRGDAGSKIRITRLIENGPIPLANAVNDDRYSVAEVSVKAIETGNPPEENVRLMPHDVIYVNKADLVYVIGGVIKPGGFALDERKTVSLIQLQGFFGGFTPTAKLKNAVIYRQLPDGSHMTIDVNIPEAKKLKPGKPELMLQADDILEIPDSLVRGTVRRTFEQVVSGLTGVAIYRPFY